MAGTNRQFINFATTLGVLKNLGDELVDLHGPHDHQSLLSPDRQLALLDGYAHTEETLREFETSYRKLQSLRAEHAALSTAESAREQEIDLLRHQINEITSANLSATEEDENATRYRLASNSKRLLELAGSISRRLSEADDSILPQLAETQRLLRDLEKIDPEKATLAEAHAACVVELSEISRVLGQYAEQLDLDPAQLAALEERVTLFETLKRKYGGSIAEVIAFGERATERMRRSKDATRNPERLDQEIGSAGAKWNALDTPCTRRAAKPRPSSPRTCARICATSVFGNQNLK